MKKFKLYLIDYYIIKKFLGTFVFALMLIICIAVIFDAAEKLDDFLEKGASVKSIVFDYYLNFIPYFAVLFSSLFTFISVIFFTSKMAYNTEIVAILNGGLSFRRMMYPYLIAASVLASCQFLLSNFVIPHANKKRFEFEEKYIHGHRIDFNQHHIHKQVEPGLFVYMESFNNTTNVGYKFSMERYDGIKLRSKIMADYVTWDSVKHIWQMNTYFKRDIDGMHEKLTHGNQLDTTLKLDAAEFRQRDNVVEAMSLGELNDYIKTLKLRGSENVSSFIIEKEKRVAYPFSTFILTIIGVTMSSRKVRGGIGMHIGLGLILSFSYILFMQFSSQFAINGSLSPFWAAWIPNIIFAFISLYLYKIAPK